MVSEIFTFNFGVEHLLLKMPMKCVKGTLKIDK